MRLYNEKLLMILDQRRDSNVFKNNLQFVF